MTLAPVEKTKPAHSAQVPRCTGMNNHRVSKLLALLILVGVSSACVVRSTPGPSRTVYRSAPMHDHRR